MLWKDTKFRQLFAATLLVVFLEIISLAGYHLPAGLAIPFYLLLIAGIGYHTLYNGFKALFRVNFKSINLLMLLAVIGAFYLGKYEEAAVVIVLYTLAEKLEDIGIAKSKSAMEALMAKMPKEVSIKGKPERVPTSQVSVGEIILVKPGEMVALDGEVVDGFSSVDESTITGEPVPMDKTKGDKVFAGTLNNQGYLEVCVTRTESNSAIAKIQELTFQATRTKAQTQKFIEKFSAIYTPVVIAAAGALAIIPPLVFHGDPNLWLLEALSILVIACPCALVISTPISIYSAIGAASQIGVLIKGGRYLEAVGQIKAIALDKTRTLTLGKPHVTEVIPMAGSMTKENLLACAAGIEAYSEHPLSESIVKAALDLNYQLHQTENFQNFVGKGVKGDCLVCDEKHHCIGKLEFILEEHHVPEEVIREMDKLQAEGYTVIIVSTHQEVEGLIALSDELRPESKAFIQELKELDVVPWMLTGDHELPAKKAAQELGIQEVHAGLLPQEKSEQVQLMLNRYGSVGMVGDGINDAPALALSSVGITMSNLGSDTAIEASSIVILNDNLQLIPRIIRLGRKALRIIRFNTFWAIMVKLVFIGLALGGMSNLVLAIFADVGVTVLVILNSLRLLNFFKNK